MKSNISTVAAVSTPFGKGGVALLRVSGPEAIGIAEKVFSPKSGKSVRALEGNRAVYGTILFRGEEIDEGILTVYRAPKSFTGEDEAEISCHGGVLVTAQVLESLLDAGAEQAGPGEFTKRAFLNGKISLARAEAAADLIDAENAHQLRLASKNAGGALERRTAAICARLKELLADVYVSVDYPDEELNEKKPEELLAAFEREEAEIKKLLDSYRTGHAVAHGVPTVIAGRPNTGKSSLLNLLLGRERAIVSEIAGTTRDTVEESALIGRVTLRLCDTAGIRRTDDPVEKMGVERSLDKLREAELVLAVFDGAEEAQSEDVELIERLKDCAVPVIAMVNKSDEERRFDLSLVKDFPTVIFSAKEKEPPKRLLEEIERLYGTGDLGSLDEGLLTNARQKKAAEEALGFLGRACAALRMHQTPDVAALDAENALSALEDIDGRSIAEDIVSSIFSRFCVGK